MWRDGTDECNTGRSALPCHDRIASQYHAQHIYIIMYIFNSNVRTTATIYNTHCVAHICTHGYNTGR